MTIIGLYVRNRLRKIHRASKVDGNWKFSCGQEDMVHRNTDIRQLVREGYPLAARPVMLCGNCWNTRNIRVTVRPDANWISQ